MITELREELAAAVRPLVGEQGSVSVTAAESVYEGNLTKLRFAVAIDAGDTDDALLRLDELLAPDAAVKSALEASNRFRVVRSSGHQPFPGGHVGATWTAEHII